MWLNGDINFWKNLCQVYISDNINIKPEYVSWKTFTMNLIKKRFQEIKIKGNSKSIGATIFISDSTSENQMFNYALNQLNISDLENYDFDYQIHISYPISDDDNNFISIKMNPI